MIEQIASAGHDDVGIPLEIVHRSSSETLLRLLEPGALRCIQAMILAELLMQDSVVQENQGQPREALISRAQDCALVADTSPDPPPRDRSICRQTIESLRTSAGDKGRI